jgi:hypothetical protein
MTYDRFYRCGMSTIAALAVNVLAIPFAVAGDLADFKSPLDNSSMIFELRSGEVETPVVKKFRETGVNGYRRRYRRDRRWQETLRIKLHHPSRC